MVPYDDGERTGAFVRETQSMFSYILLRPLSLNFPTQSSSVRGGRRLILVMVPKKGLVA